MTRPLTGRVVLLTGITAGIGRTTTLRLLDRGARVVGCARDVADLEPVPGLTAVEADVTEAAGRERLVATALATHGRIDALVNNAGIGWVGRIEDMPEESVRPVVDTNLTAVMDLTRRVLPGMLARGDGDVVMISSAAAWFPTPSLAVYSGTKAGVDGFAHAVRREVGARGVRVHTVNPGPVRTEWLPRSAGSAPGEPDRITRLGPGVPPVWVARAVEGCLTRPRARTVGVPRAVELARLALVPGIDRLLDAVLSRVGPAITTRALDLARDRVHGPPRG
ncbi:MAG TPA: SDR family oxidoreductase [Mycobacteriales bacterium]|jgi:NAD(P)-dependent dehydrogenase (short-subunit alcohol dehydrogenase family)